jgi:hypothetical protein
MNNLCTKACFALPWKMLYFLSLVVMFHFVIILCQNFTHWYGSSLVRTLHAIREYCDGNTILKVVYDDTVSASTILYFTSDKKGAFHNQPQPANRTPMENYKWTGYKNSVSLFWFLKCTKKLNKKFIPMCKAKNVNLWTNRIQGISK